MDTSQEYVRDFYVNSTKVMDMKKLGLIRWLFG